MSILTKLTSEKVGQTPQSQAVNKVSCTYTQHADSSSLSSFTSGSGCFSSLVEWIGGLLSSFWQWLTSWCSPSNSSPTLTSEAAPGLSKNETVQGLGSPRSVTETPPSSQNNPTEQLSPSPEIFKKQLIGCARNLLEGCFEGGQYASSSCALCKDKPYVGVLAYVGYLEPEKINDCSFGKSVKAHSFFYDMEGLNFALEKLAKKYTPHVRFSLHLSFMQPPETTQGFVASCMATPDFVEFRKLTKIPKSFAFRDEVQNLPYDQQSEILSKIAALT